MARRNEPRSGEVRKEMAPRRCGDDETSGHHLARLARGSDVFECLRKKCGFPSGDSPPVCIFL